MVHSGGCMMDSDECGCRCHTNGGMHVVSCCDGRCDRCGKFIKSGMMEIHKSRHRATEITAKEILWKKSKNK